MHFANILGAAVLLGAAPSVLGSAIQPVERDGVSLNPRAVPLTVHIGSITDYCLVVPKNAHTNIGDSEYPGGETVWCSSGAKSKVSSTGTFKGSFWQSGKVALKKTSSYVQLTGCINVGSSDRLNKNDGGGQYDSNGGDGGRGNPAGSKCAGYNSYVEIIEPDAKRACLRCCKNAGDCPTYKDTSGCPAVIPGNYFNCN